MGILTDSRELKLLKHMFGQEDLAIPNYLYMGLHVGAPTEASPSTNEISGGGYARILLVDNATNNSYNASASGMSTVFELTTHDNLTNASAIDFAEATGNWGTVSHYSIWDSATATTAGNCLMIGALSSGVAVGSGDQFRIAVGEFDLTFPSKLGKGAVTSTTIPSTFDEYLFYDATEWRRQVARRLGFLNKPWGPATSGVYKWDFDTNAVDSGDTDAVAEQIHTKNTYWPQVSLSPFSLGYTSEHFSNPGSTLTRDLNDDALYLALYKTDPGTNVTSVYNTSDELNGNGYARQRLIYKPSASSAGSSVFSTATTSGGVTSIVNDTAIAFPEATSDWGSISHWGIYRGTDSAGSGSAAVSGSPSSSAGYAKASHPFMVGALTTARTVNSGDILRFGIGDFSIKLD